MIEMPIWLVFILGMAIGASILFLYLEFLYGKEVQEGEYEVCGRSISIGYESYSLKPLKDQLEHDSRTLRDVEVKGLTMMGQYRVKFFYGYISGKRYILQIEPIMIPQYVLLH